MALYFPMEEYETRWARVDAAMEGKDYDAPIVWSRAGGTYDRCCDVLYLTNYVSTESGQEPDNKTRKASAFSAVLLVRGEKPRLIADEPPPEDAIATNNWEWSYDTVSRVEELLKPFGNRSVALAGSDILPMKYGQQMFGACPNLAMDDMLIHEVRMKQSPREVEAMRIGGEIAARALTILMEDLRRGEKEADAATLATAEVMCSGGAVHFIPVNYGDSIEQFCHNHLTGYSQDALQDGDLVRACVYGLMLQGYWMDPGCTTVVGTPGPARPRRSWSRIAQAFSMP